MGSHEPARAVSESMLAGHLVELLPSFFVPTLARELLGRAVVKFRAPGQQIVVRSLVGTGGSIPVAIRTAPALGRLRRGVL